MRFRTFTSVALVVFLLACAGFSQDKAVAPASSTAMSAYAPVTEYDPARDASKDVAAAIHEAQRTNRNVLVEVGGKWCSWCRYLDKFFADHADILQYREANYVMVKVNFSPENKNETLISRYGTIPGYPHFFVLDGNGKLLQSQDTSKLEEGKGYNPDAMMEFLKKWAPKTTSASK